MTNVTRRWLSLALIKPVQSRLEDAVAAYGAALEVRTRERVPLEWALTQSNLGNALRALGERESDTAHLEEAVAASRAALQERTRERVPLALATTQNYPARRARKWYGASGGGKLQPCAARWMKAPGSGCRSIGRKRWAIKESPSCFSQSGVAIQHWDRALGQITAGIETLSATGHSPAAVYFESKLPEVQALRDTGQVIICEVGFAKHPAAFGAIGALQRLGQRLRNTSKAPPRSASPVDRGLAQPHITLIYVPEPRCPPSNASEQITRRIESKCAPDCEVFQGVQLQAIDRVG
ncbi:tetratricopeptide repeat protein [Mesorhizobium sp. M0814]|uniref:tetratricopeptide repeat protein n=1 Tax=Mesorhizobium sp. M0814 TaxID=2957004 RepID=UPI0033370B8D